MHVCWASLLNVDGQMPWVVVQHKICACKLTSKQLSFDQTATITFRNCPLEHKEEQSLPIVATF